MGIGEFLFGTKDKIKKIGTLTPEQQAMMGQLSGALGGAGIPQMLGQHPSYQTGMGYLNALYGQSPEAFERFKAPYMRQFQQETVPGIASRFGSMGTGGALSSSAFQQAMGRAGENLSSTLGAQFEGLRANLLPQLMQYAQAPMDQYRGLWSSLMGTKAFEPIFMPRQPGFVQQGLAGLLQGAGQGAGVGLALPAMAQLSAMMI